MFGQGSHANPKIFQLDDYKKSLLMVLFQLSQGCSRKEIKIHLVSDVLAQLNQQLRKSKGTSIDSKELIRMLYILEGWELCCPVPETKLTSQRWRLTQRGYEMVQNIIKNLQLNLESVF
ncbi:MAG: hypothetical protein NZO16_07010 [Deltaproteobacteria bacterium]|nr:hypothetical protein [Deltaproteobacteria bacterium]